MSDHIRTYGARPYGFRSAPKPANFDALTRAAADAHHAERDHDEQAAAAARDTFSAEHGKYRDQAARAGVHPGVLLGMLEQDGEIS